MRYDARQFSVFSREFAAAAAVAALLGVGCAGTHQPDPAAREWRDKLGNAIREPVASREQRDEHSRVLLAAVDHEAVVGLNSDQVRAALGPGEPCSGQSLCAEQGFAGDDLYYAIGQKADDKIKQLPVLIVGFDAHGTVKRVYTLKTH
jgi:hypothetical protein